MILVGDCLRWLKRMKSESVHCCITSPPYFGLRDYGCEGQIGLEKSLEDYVEVLVRVFREVNRVLRYDGTLWLNLGDSYASAWPCNRRNVVGNGPLPNGKREARPPRLPSGLKEKDLMGVPWRVAFALQEDGWYLRSDVIWEKPNAMTESVRDRPTRAHEYLFLFSKRERYYYDSWAIKEPAVSIGRSSGNKERKCAVSGERSRLNTHLGSSVPWTDRDGLRNRRSVWKIPVKPIREAHFATFPPDLVEPCLLAGTSEYGACAGCGESYRRVIERTGHVNRREPAHVPNNVLTKTDSTGWAPTTRPTDRWEPACTCEATLMPCHVLDPFAGSGTVGLVARQRGRLSTLIELNPEYAEITRRRIYGDQT